MCGLFKELCTFRFVTNCVETYNRREALVAEGDNDEANDVTEKHPGVDVCDNVVWSLCDVSVKLVEGMLYP